MLLHRFSLLGGFQFLRELHPFDQGAIQILDHLLTLFLLTFVLETSILEQGHLTIIPIFRLFEHLVKRWRLELLAKVDLLLVVILLVQKTLQPQVYFVRGFTLLVGFFFAVNNHLSDFAVSRLNLRQFFKTVLVNLLARLL